jgi:hypothetical protein
MPKMIYGFYSLFVLLIMQKLNTMEISDDITFTMPLHIGDNIHIVPFSEYLSNCNNLNASSQGLGFLLHVWSFKEVGHIICNANVY